MIAYARIFSGSYSNKLQQRFFRSFTGSNLINGCVKNKGVFFESNNELPNSSVSVKKDSFVSINLQSILLRVLRRVFLLSSHNGQ